MHRKRLVCGIFLVRIMHSALYLYSWTCSIRISQKSMNYILFEHKHSFRVYFFRPLHRFFSIRKSRWTLFFLNLSVNMSNNWENYKLVSLILCVNFSTKFRFIEFFFQVVIVLYCALGNAERPLGNHTSCVVPQVAHCVIAQRVAQQPFKPRMNFLVINYDSGKYIGNT
jgi:hypothetical protein